MTFYNLGPSSPSSNIYYLVQIFHGLRSMLSVSGELRYEIASCINISCIKWSSTTGILCDQCITKHLKSKICGSVIRSVALYGVVGDNKRQ